MTKETCETCKFCVIKRGPPHTYGSADTFTCHRYPPVKMRGFTFGVRCEVEKNEWCGEWIAKQEVDKYDLL